QLAQQAHAGNAAFGARGEEDAVEAADLAFFEQLGSVLAQLAQEASLRAHAKDARLVGGMKLRRHGREGKQASHAALSRVVEQPMAEGVSAGVGLRLAEE